MIAKITKGRDHGGVVRYVLQEKKNAELIDSKDVLITDKQSIIDSFYLQCQLNHNVSVTVGHISLDFSAEDADCITNELMVRIAQEYMARMNILNTQYILARHYDREHPHCHLVFNRIDNDGKLISDRNDRLRSMKICWELTKKYGLHIAAGKEHVKRERLKGPDSTKYRIYDALMKSVPKCKNWEDLTKALSKDGIKVSFIHRGSTVDIQGVVFEMNGIKFNGSKIDRNCSYSKISAVLQHNGRQMAEYPHTNKSSPSSSGQERSYSNSHECAPSHPSANESATFENENTSSHTTVASDIVSSVISDTASILTSVSTGIVSGIGHAVVGAMNTPNVAPSGGGGGSSPDDLSDDEYIDEYGIRRKKRRGRRR
jgi:hypothetical protein